MKKTFFNDLSAFGTWVILTIGDLMILRICLINVSANELFTVIICIVLFGGISIISLFFTWFYFELITVYDDKIVSFKIFKKRVEIFYDEIDSIKETYENSGLGARLSWEFKTTDNKIIHFVKTKKRKKILEKLIDLDITSA